MPYVVALYRQAVEENVLPSVTTAVSAIHNALHKVPEAVSFLKIPFIPFEDKISILNKFTPKKAPALFISFLTVLGENRKLNHLEPLLRKFLEYADHKSGREHIKIVSAFALNPDVRKSLKSAIETQLQKPVELFTTIDPSLIGGIIIHYYHHELDLSLKNEIFSLKSALKELYL